MKLTLTVPLFFALFVGAVVLLQAVAIFGLVQTSWSSDEGMRVYRSALADCQKDALACLRNDPRK